MTLGGRYRGSRPHRMNTARRVTVAADIPATTCATESFDATDAALMGSNTDLAWDVVSIPSGAGVVRSNAFALTGTGSGTAQCWLTSTADFVDDAALSITIAGKGSASSAGDNWQVGLHGRANAAWDPTMSSPRPSGWYVWAGGLSGSDDRIYFGFTQEDGGARWLVDTWTGTLTDGDVLGLRYVGHDDDLLVEAILNGSTVLTIDKAALVTYGFDAGDVSTLEPAGLRYGTSLFADGSGGVLATIVAALESDAFEACPA